jgi:hypothetical protein
MGIDPNWIRGCLHKKVYKTRDFAEGVAKRMGHTVYLCPHCANWHTTSGGRFKNEKNKN